MPGLKDLLKKKDKISEHASKSEASQLAPPEFTFIRSTTGSEEVIQPPLYPGDERPSQPKKDSKEHRRGLGFRQVSNSPATRELAPAVLSNEAQKSSQQLPIRAKGERRLSERLHLHKRERSRSGSATSSTNLPDNLPEAPETIAVQQRKSSGKQSSLDGDVEDKDTKERQEAQWEKRATILAMNSPLQDGQRPNSGHSRQRSRSPSISDATGDVNIQEAINSHEAGDLERSTKMFGQLAHPDGANNALAQVLYGLALRHGWGCAVEPERAIHFLQLAASNSAAIEEAALKSGINKGGAAKGELVLAIFELANCFRHGYGIKKDAVAARQYYETAANLGDTDAMEEAAWCYLEGFGGGKDKVRATKSSILPC